MERVKVYLDETHIAGIVCGSCGKHKEMDFSGKEPPRSAVVKCSCGNAFVVSFEKRQNYRKPVDFWGISFASADPKKGEPVKILDISLGGLKFQRTGKTELQSNQKLKIGFKLKDQTVNMVVRVCHILDDCVGAEIVDIDAHSRKILGFYLMP